MRICKTGLDSSSSFEVFLLGRHGDSFGCKEGVNADALDKKMEGDSQNFDKLSEGEYVNLPKLFINIWNTLYKVVLCKVVSDGLSVDVLPSSSEVDKPNNGIEDGFNLFRVRW